MVVKCCVTSFFLKYKIAIILITFVVIFALFNFIQVIYKVFAHVETKYFFNEPIDVVYTWVNGSDPKFLQSLHDYLHTNSTTQDYSNQRFDDKYELKFSLRSLEKYAPWIHHVYIVTNGQIPYWLNLDYEKVTLVSHEDIFMDEFDLPSFSSPAIESHLHRIPGLSNRFIYFNDDIFLGAPMYIDDFLSPSRGYLVYLAWPLPMCAVDCPWVYVGDGQCDSACYNANCQMDGGDCSIMNKVQNSWEENFLINSKEVFGSNLQSNDNVPNIALNLNQNSSSQKEQKQNEKYLNLSELNNTWSFINKYSQRNNSSNTNTKLNTMSLKMIFNNRRHHDLPKPLNNSKLALKVEPTLATRRIFLKMNNSTNLTNVVEQHNKSIILHNKLKRRKRMTRKNFKKDNPMVHISNSTLISKIRNSNINIDAYGASLQHTNRIYNLRYGFKSRYAPAHAPVMISKRIMGNLQEAFAKEFKRTSRNRIRSEDDMQFAFSYYYYLINEKMMLSVSEIFDSFDTDNSGTWSDREIRTVLTKLYDLPLSYATVDHFEDVLLNCSKQQPYPEITTPDFERYVDSKLPTVSRELVVNCPILSTILKEQFGLKHKYKYEIISNAQSTHVTFKMLNSNISEVVGHLDEIRRHTKKFVCLNDNMDELKASENELIRAVLYDFYLSLFPNPSKFELPTDFRNRFLYIDELNQWKSYHFKLKICTYVCIFVLCYVTYCNLFKRRILYRFVNKLFC